MQSNWLLSDQIAGGLENDIGLENVVEGSDVRAPLPVKRDVLYDSPVLYGGSRMGFNPHEAHTVVPFRNFEEEVKRPGVWETDQGSASTTHAARENLATLYRPPFGIIYHGSFQKVLDLRGV